MASKSRISPTAHVKKPSKCTSFITEVPCKCIFTDILMRNNYRSNKCVVTCICATKHKMWNIVLHLLKKIDVGHGCQAIKWSKRYNKYSQFAFWCKPSLTKMYHIPVQLEFGRLHGLLVQLLQKTEVICNVYLILQIFDYTMWHIHYRFKIWGLQVVWCFWKTSLMLTKDFIWSKWQ